MKQFLVVLSLLATACGDDTTSVDAGPSIDSGTPVLAAERRRMAEARSEVIFCGCEVEEGMETSIAECVASSTGISTAAEVACIQGALDSAPESNTSVFDCQTQFFENFNACLNSRSRFEDTGTRIA